MKKLLLLALLGVLLAPLKSQAMIPLEMKFAGLPYELQVVSLCESGGRQFDSKGNLITSYTQDHGFMQINEKAHGKTAKELGFDIYSDKGNMAYGYYLYLTEGLRPWKSSKGCWSKQLVVL